MGSPYEASFSSWLALTFTTSNLCFLALANATQRGVRLLRNASPAKLKTIRSAG